jgi:two-component sensor histidine kinase
LLVEHGIRRAMNVILQGDGKPFGVLEVDSRSDGEFSEHDIAFLQGAANILGMAIEQQLSNSKLKSALERHQVLLKEINHRVKNSLQVVAAMLRLQSSASNDTQLREALAEASSRVLTVGRAYERLAYNADFETIELVAYIREVCADLDKEILPCRLHLEAPETVEFPADRAILVALIINELVLNAARHAYPDRPGETIWVSIARAEPNVLLASVRDEGVGLPADFDPKKSKRLGALLVTALSKQLNAEMTRPPCTKGTNVTLRIPMD